MLTPDHPYGSRSCWMESVPEELPSQHLKANEQCDVCVVGAGICGLTTAYYLLLQGKSVIILDKERIGFNQTVRSTGHLTYALDDRFIELEKLFGITGSTLAGQSHAWAIHEVGRLSTQEKIDAEYAEVDGYLFAGREQDRMLLYDEEAACHRSGLKEVCIDNQSAFPHYDTGPVLRFPRQAQIHPAKYLLGLAKVVIRLGGKLYSHAKVVKTQSKPPLVTTSDGFSVSANDVIFATNTPINNRFITHTKQAAYRTYVIGAIVPKDSLKQGLYWDTLYPYHYVRVWERPEKDLLIIGGADHKTGQKRNPEALYKYLEDWSRKRFPQIEQIAYQWSGQVLETVDALGLYGRNPHEQHIYIATGDSGNGLTHGTLGAKIISDLILDKSNEWTDLYAPKRITWGAWENYLKENANTAAQYTDWLNPQCSRTGTYTDENGKQWEVTKVCPHLGAILRWNESEKTWDCPAHGSRFDCQGKVINGPASTDISV